MVNEICISISSLTSSITADSVDSWLSSDKQYITKVIDLEYCFGLSSIYSSFSSISEEEATFYSRFTRTFFHLIFQKYCSIIHRQSSYFKPSGKTSVIFEKLANSLIV